MKPSTYDEYPVKPLKSTRLPQSTIVLSVTASLDGDRTGYTERWRTGCASFARTAGRKRHGRHETMYGHPSQMWDDITQWCGYRGLVFAWTHDLSRTARLSAMFIHMPSLGWKLDGFSLNPGASWTVWRRKESTLKLCDVTSIWPVALDRVAQLFGMARHDTPQQSSHHMAWEAHARRDARIIRTAVDAYADWVRADDLGSLAVTGNGQAWRAFRRRFMTSGVLIHNDSEAREAERRAMWTGRCEAWWRGTIDFAVVHEWDLTAAYTNIVRESQVPVLLHGRTVDGAPIDRYLHDRRYELLAEVDVETEAPVVPALQAGHIVWPVGRFPTVLWGPELRTAVDSGAAVRLRRGWLYRRAPALREWGDWVIGGLDDTSADNPAWRRAILKRWGNVLIGHFAMQYPEWRKVGWSPDYDVRCTPMHEVESGEASMLMQVGHDVWERCGMRDSVYYAPMITGWVMSEARTRLWQIMQQLPPRALLYVDTDSLLVTDQWLREMTDLQDSHVGRGLRLKRSWDGISIYGPRQVVTGQAARIAGLPKGATRTGRHDFEGDVVEGLLEAMGERRLDEVRLIPRQWRIEGVDTRRHGSGSGWTEPFTLNDQRGSGQ
jgi:hypothetical protein